MRSLPDTASSLGRAGFAEGAPCWIDVAAPDPGAAARFYGALFGWAFEDQRAGGEADGWLVARLRGLRVAGIGALPRYVPPPAWSMYVRVASVDDAAERVKRAGGDVVTAPFEVAEAGRAAVCADPLGARFRLWEDKGDAGVELVNAPNAWAWSGLTTTDPERAASFYATLFGWRSERGMIGRMSGAARGVQPQWMVTFAVDDVGDAIRLAADLGGMTIVQPFDDASGARAAVLADPFGASFAVTSSEATSPRMIRSV